MYRPVISTRGEYSEQQSWTSLIAQRVQNVTYKVLFNTLATYAERHGADASCQ